MTDWLIDTSALVRLGASPEAGTWADRIDRGLVRIATVTCLEVGYSARSGPELHVTRTAVRPGAADKLGCGWRPGLVSE
ncbi:MAG: PIN domain-containing protein [Acidimicrobiales bacterium]